jgi:diguanylate cyclase (GGDEF)-like protein
MALEAQASDGDREAITSLQQLDTLFEKRLWNGVMVLVIVLTPISVLRSLHTGWLQVYTVHLVVAGLMLAIHFARHRIPRRGLSVIALIYLESMGALGLMLFGLMSFGCLWLLISSFLAGAVFGYRAGQVAVALNLLLIAVAMTLFMQGQLTLPVVASVYMKSAIVWVLALLMMTVTPIMLLNTLVQHKHSNRQLVLQVEQQRQEIEHLSMHDALTGLVTKRLAQDRLDTALKHASRAGDRAAVLFIDLDGFKRINDQFGHGAGDMMLRALGKVLLDAVRNCDTVARIGGDEFLVILEDLQSPELAGSIAQRILDGIHAPVTFGRHELRVSASIGIALFPDHGSDGATLQKAADAAMYGVKTSGKNNIGLAVGGTETGAWMRPKIGERTKG